MRNLFVFLLIMTVNSINTYSQSDNGTVYAQFNTVLVYSNYTINYESKNLFPSFERHSLRLTAGIGGWSTSAFNKNTGALINYGLNYQFGSKSHLLEIDINSQNHFDKGLKEQSIVFIGSTFRPFIGYRYQPIAGQYYFKIGTGWREVFQIGFGIRI